MWLLKKLRALDNVMLSKWPLAQIPVLRCAGPPGAGAVIGPQRPSGDVVQWVLLPLKLTQKQSVVRPILRSIGLARN